MGQVRVEQRGHVLLATLDNPPHGLMDRGTVAGLIELIARAESDEGVGAVVLTGAQPGLFAAHYDVAELLEGARTGPAVGRRAASATVRAVDALRRVPGLEQALARTPAAGVAALLRFRDALLGMNRCPAVFVAAMNGSAQGGASELALACDLRIMAEGDHRLGQPEILFGFTPGGGGTQRLARMVGSARALRLVLDGGPLSPAEAAELGVVDEVVPAGDVVDRAMAHAERLGRRTRAAIGAVKRAVYDGGSLPLAGGLRLECAEFLATLVSPESQTAMASYLDELERTGRLPGYDPEVMGRTLERGRFGA